MILEEALDIIVGRTKHERYRWLCSEENGDVESRDAYRQLMIGRARGEPDPEVTRLDQAYAEEGAEAQPGGCARC